MNIKKKPPNMVSNVLGQIFDGEILCRGDVFFGLIYSIKVLPKADIGHYGIY